ncbi:hypothetical protein D7Y16_01870 [Stenotrophomonas maltophilia]|nr:hypothetical protein [Stenotrophomonas maltophilia]MBA0245668.1 hypothetical protein [Stenotrophomonas maltophilia]MBA0305583.1 hypothetical protein [Stenotrophomonas maltophilia]MBA0438309.1 hypothetical protein [Stenotrophomonas maltophilia]MBA0514726.1 hypothetical protein [Stenotrophomonas maltophilia]
MRRAVRERPRRGFEHNIHYAKSNIRQIWAFVGSAWQWLGLWLGSCLRPQSPAKDELAACSRSIRTTDTLDFALADLSVASIE